jgi:acetylornithine deacetylase
VSPVRTPSAAGDEGILSRWRNSLLDYVDSHAQDIVADLADFVRLPSISGSDEENEIQFRLATRLQTFGLDVDHWKIPLTETLCEADFPGVEVDRLESWGTVGKLPGDGSGPSLMLNAHVDVVPPGDRAAWGDAVPFGGYVGGSAVHGRGACDMKGGLVASLWVMRAMSELRVPLCGDLLLGAVIGEEDGGLGTYAMLRRGWRADGCVIPEPTSLDIAPGNCGSLTFRLTIRGAATHASRRSSGVSAVEKFVSVFQALRQLEAERNQTKHPLATRWDIPIPIELGVVQSGDWASSVPDRLTADGRLGVAIGEDVAEAKKALETALAELGESDPWLRKHPVEVSWWGGQFAPGFTDPDASVISAVRRAHQQVSSHDQDTWVTTYGSDLRLMRNIGGVPTVHYGPGDASLAHGPREQVPIDEVLTATRALTLTALGHCGVR